MNDSPYNYAIRNKFHNEQSDRHNGNLQWPGINGIPVRGTVQVHLKEEEKQYAVLVGDFHCQYFNLNKEEDRQYYTWVKDRIVNGWFQQLHHNHSFKDGEEYPHIYLEWVQMYYEWPQDLVEHIRILNKQG